MPPRPDLSSPRMNLRLSDRRIFISDFKSLHICPLLVWIRACRCRDVRVRTNSRVPLPRRLPRARPALPALYESGDPRRASLPRTNNKKGDEINRPTPHYQAQLRAAKNRRRIFLNEFPKAGRDQPAVRRPPIERLPYARLIFRRFHVTTACAPKLKKHIFLTQNDLTNNSIQLNKKVKKIKKNKNNWIHIGMRRTRLRHTKKYGPTPHYQAQLVTSGQTVFFSGTHSISPTPLGVALFSVKKKSE